MKNRLNIVLATAMTVLLSGCWHFGPKDAASMTVAEVESYVRPAVEGRPMLLTLGKDGGVLLLVNPLASSLDKFQSELVRDGVALPPVAGSTEMRLTSLCRSLDADYHRQDGSQKDVIGWRVGTYMYGGITQEQPSTIADSKAPMGFSASAKDSLDVTFAYDEKFEDYGKTLVAHGFLKGGSKEGHATLVRDASGKWQIGKVEIDPPQIVNTL